MKIDIKLDVNSLFPKIVAVVMFCFLISIYPSAFAFKECGELFCHTFLGYFMIGMAKQAFFVLILIVCLLLLLSS